MELSPAEKTKKVFFNTSCKCSHTSEHVHGHILSGLTIVRTGLGQFCPFDRDTGLLAVQVSVSLQESSHQMQSNSGLATTHWLQSGLWEPHLYSVTETGRILNRQAMIVFLGLHEVGKCLVETADCVKIKCLFLHGTPSLLSPNRYKFSQYRPSTSP